MIGNAPLSKLSGGGGNLLPQVRSPNAVVWRAIQVQQLLVGFVEAGRHDGCFYYVMHHLTGGTLRDRIERTGPGTPGTGRRRQRV